MPIYTYRREDGTEFDIRQKFSDDPLTVDPETGQAVQRIIQPVGVVFKGSGFYVNDSKAKSSTSKPVNGTDDKAADSTEAKSDTKSEAKTDDKPAKAEKKESTPAKTESSKKSSD